VRLDVARLIANAVRWALDEEPVVNVQGPGILDVTVWRQPSSMTVHLVNLKNPMMMRGPFREILPVGSQQVRVRLPDGKKAGGVRLLTSNTSPSVEEASGTISLTVTSIPVHEVVAIDL
jgi:hypothetical protein